MSPDSKPIPQVKVISRDRGEAYAEAAREAVPQAIEVCDTAQRWPAFALADALVVSSASGADERQATGPTDPFVTVQRRIGNDLPTDSSVYSFTARTQRRGFDSMVEEDLYTSAIAEPISFAKGLERDEELACL